MPYLYWKQEGQRAHGTAQVGLLVDWVEESGTDAWRLLFVDKIKRQSAQKNLRHGNSTPLRPTYHTIPRSQRKIEKLKFIAKISSFLNERKPTEWFGFGHARAISLGGIEGAGCPER